MSRSAIYTTNVSNPAVAAGGVIPIGTTARRFGCALRQDGNAVTASGQGYFLVTASATVTPAAAGTISLTAQKDGVGILGATASATVAATDTAVNLCVTALVRNLCQCDSANLSFILSAAATVNNLAVTVEKL